MILPKVWVKQISLCVEEEGKPKRLIEDISLSLTAGSVHALIGPSGSGKSTLLMAINRMREIENGQILFDGTDIKDFNVFDLRRHVGIVFQKPAFFPGTVGENIIYGPKLRREKKSYSSADIPAPEHFLTMVGLEPDLSGREPSTLSGGQQQRVALARTLANDPEVLLLDEPTSALDAQAGQVLEKLVSELCLNKRLTVLWVTHDLEQAKRVAQDITLIGNGRVVEQGSTSELFAHPRTEEARRYLLGREERK